MDSALYANGVISLATQRLHLHVERLAVLEQADGDPMEAMLERIRCAQFQVLREIARRRYVDALSREAQTGHHAR